MSASLFTERPVECCCSKGSSSSKLGKVAIGHGLVYLEGTILRERIDGSPRAMIGHAISVVPRCGGCPMMTTTHNEAAAAASGAALFGFVHGYSNQHRHNSRARVVVAAEASSNNNNHLFADALQPGELHLRPVIAENRVHDALKAAAENYLLPVVDEPEADEEQQHRLTDEECPRIIHHIAEKLQIPFKLDEKFSIRSIMNRLADAAFDLRAPRPVLGDVVHCVVPKGQQETSISGTSGVVADGKDFVLVGPEKAET